MRRKKKILLVWTTGGEKKGDYQRGENGKEWDELKRRQGREGTEGKRRIEDCHDTKVVREKNGIYKNGCDKLGDGVRYRICIYWGLERGLEV